MAQLRRVLRHLLDQMQKTILTTQHRKTPTTPEKNLLYRTTLSIPNYTELHQTSRHYTKVDLLQLLHQTTPNFTYYIKLHRTLPTTSNYTKLHLLHQTTPNCIYYTKPHQTTPITPTSVLLHCIKEKVLIFTVDGVEPCSSLVTVIIDLLPIRRIYISLTINAHTNCRAKNSLSTVQIKNGTKQSAASCLLVISGRQIQVHVR